MVRPDCRSVPAPPSPRSRPRPEGIRATRSPREPAPGIACRQRPRQDDQPVINGSVIPADWPGTCRLSAPSALRTRRSVIQQTGRSPSRSQTPAPAHATRAHSPVGSPRPPPVRPQNGLRTDWRQVIHVKLAPASQPPVHGDEAWMPYQSRLEQRAAAAPTAARPVHQAVVLDPRGGRDYPLLLVLIAVAVACRRAAARLDNAAPPELRDDEPLVPEPQRPRPLPHWRPDQLLRSGRNDRFRLQRFCLSS